MASDSVQNTIREFLITELFYDQEIDQIGAEDSLADYGLDSLGVFKTVAFCEENFGIRIPDEEVLPDNFQSIRAIAELVERISATK